MKQITIDIPDNIYSYVEVRAAIDDLRIKEAIEGFVIELASAKMEGRAIKCNA